MSLALSPRSVRAAVALGLLVACGAAAVHADAAAPAPGEYEVKAAFLYNFTKFISWPPEVLGRPESPFVIGVMGENPFGDALERLVAGKTLDGHPYVVRGLHRGADLRDCQLLFISRSEEAWLGEVLESARRHPVLTVSEIPAFLEREGMIQLTVDDSKVRFGVNRNTAGRGGLRVSSKLLALAAVVVGEAGTGKE